MKDSKKAVKKDTNKEINTKINKENMKGCDKDCMEEVLEELEAEDAARHRQAEEENSENVKSDDGGDAPDETGESAPGDTEQETEEEPLEKKGKAGKKEEALKEKIVTLEDQVKRQMAEFDNFRKRTEREKSQMFEAGASTVIEKLLPVLDNFERGLGTLTEEEKTGSFAEGMAMVYKQFGTELENLGVKPIEALGTAFNPEFHNAVMQDTEGEGESGTVTKELLKGYMYRDTVVRHSMVAVKS